MRVDRAADIVFCCGAPETGKSHRIKQLIAADRPDRLITIDPDGEYVGQGYLHRRLVELEAVVGYPTFRTRFQPHHERAIAEKQFDRVCRLVRWLADPQPGQVRPARVGPITFVVDELADYVGASFHSAPASWQWIVRRGRKYGVTVRAASQRPAEIDKTLFNLASTIRTGRLNDLPDQRRLANALNVPLPHIQALTGTAYIERDKRTGGLVYWPKAPVVDRSIDRESIDRPVARPAGSRRTHRQRESAATTGDRQHESLPQSRRDRDRGRHHRQARPRGA